MLFSLAVSSPAVAAPVTAMPAHRLVNAVGVATHFDWDPNVYAKKFDDVSALLRDLGVRHIRQRPGNAAAAARLRRLYTELGVKLTAVIDARSGSGCTEKLNTSGIAPILRDLKAQLNLDMVAALEGPNEWNLKERNCKRTTWAQELRPYQAELHRQLKADPQLAKKPLVAPSLSDPMMLNQYTKLGNIEAWTDRGNAHIYPNWLSFERKFNDVLPYARTAFPTQKFVVSESGWHTAYNSGAQFIDEKTKMKYLGRALVTYASHPNLERVFYYQLVDDKANPALNTNSKHMGLTAHDLKPKGSYHAVRNTMAVMCDNPLAFAPKSFGHQLTGDLTDVRTVLFQKKNGAFYLVVWIEQPGFYKDNPIAVAPRPVTLNLDQAVSTIRRYRPTDPSKDPKLAYLPEETKSGSSKLFSFQVQDNITILELVPTGVATPPVNSGKCTFQPT